MNPLLFLVCLAVCPPGHTTDTITVARDTLRTDTLREITVRADNRLPFEIMFEEKMKEERRNQIHVPSLGEVLQKRFPRLNDIICNPTAIKERRREARRRRALRVIEEYDKVRTFDDLLREAYEKQMREDSLLMHK